MKHQNIIIIKHYYNRSCFVEDGTNVYNVEVHLSNRAQWLQIILVQMMSPKCYLVRETEDCCHFNQFINDDEVAINPVKE